MTNTHTNIRKERQRLVNQFDILKAASQLVAAKGLHNVSMEDIARKAGFGKGTLYNYFQNKEALIFAMAAGIINSYHKEIASIINSKSVFQVKLKRCLKASLSFIDKEPAATFVWDFFSTHLQFSSIAGPSDKISTYYCKFHEIFVDFFKNATKNKELRKIDPMGLSITMFAAMESLKKADRVKGVSFSNEKNVNFVYNLLMEKL